MELRAEDVAARDDDRERPAVVADAERRRRGRGLRRRRSARGRRPPGRARPSRSGDAPRDSAPRSSRCAGASGPGAAPARARAPASSPSPSSPPSSSEPLEEQLHPEAQAEHRRARRARARAPARRGRPRAAAASPRGTRRRPGTTSPSAARSALVVGGQRDARADALERLLDQRRLPSAVVDDADGGDGRRSPRQRALRRRDARLRRVDRDGRAQRAREGLERRLDHVVGVRARLDAQVQREPRAVLATARKNSSVSSWSKPPVPPGRQVGVEGAAAAGRRRRSRRSRAPRPSARRRGRSA